MKRRNYETKNNVDLVEDPVTGRPKFVEAEKDEVMTNFSFDWVFGDNYQDLFKICSLMRSVTRKSEISWPNVGLWWDPKKKRGNFEDRKKRSGRRKRKGHVTTRMTTNSKTWKHRNHHSMMLPTNRLPCVSLGGSAPPKKDGLVLEAICC